MYTIVISESASTGEFGELIVEDAAGNPVLGPCPVAMSPQTAGEAVEEYVVGDIVSIAGGDQGDVARFGRYGIVVLRSSHAGADAEAGERFLYSGIQAELEPAPEGAFRLRPEHHRALVRLLQGCEGELRCRVQAAKGRTVERDASSEPPYELPSALLRTHVKRLAASAAGLAISPFVLSRKARAQVDCMPYEGGMAFSAVDFGILAAREGGTQTAGFVPNDNSGVTVAAGMDLGNITEAQLVEMGFSAEKIAGFRPYVAASPSQPRTGPEARSALAAFPLKISQAEANEMNRLYFAWQANKAGSAFNQAVQQQGLLQGTTFSSLPSRLQTSIVDMAIADPGFLASDTFARFAKGQWSAALLALSRYSGTEHSETRAKAMSARLTKMLTRLPVPTYRRPLA